MKSGGKTSSNTKISKTGIAAAYVVVPVATYLHQQAVCSVFLVTS